MIVIEKVALAELLRTWRSWFGDNWATAEQAIRYLCFSDDRELLYQASLKNGDSDALSQRLDELRDRLFYNYVVKRNVPYMQPVKWRVLLQDNRVKISNEERSDFLAVRKEAGLKIDAATAEVDWSEEQVFDPYAISDLKREAYCVGREYFARSPGSYIWVSFRDLPDATRKALEKSRAKEPDLSWLWLEPDKPIGTCEK